MRATSYPPGRFCWVDLATDDLHGSRSFYGDFFGWQATELDTGGGPPYLQFTLDGDPVAGLGELPPEDRQRGVRPNWSSYVAVDDIDAVAGRVGELGGRVTVPPMQVLDAGRLAFVSDPGGAQLGLWQAGSHHGSARIDEPCSFCWNELATRDLDAARDFFAGLFGWQYADNPAAPSRYAIIRHGGRDQGGVLEMTDDWGDMPSHWMVYFAVEDCDSAAKRVADRGGAVHVPPFDIPVGRIAVVADPRGAVFSLIQLQSPSEPAG